MTLVLTVNGSESLWLVADRRLSSPSGCYRDDARKLMFLETADGVAILGYAGLGATAGGTEPADWMSAVLRGRNLPLEQSLGILAEAARKQLPRHVVGLHGATAVHNVLVSAFVGDEPRIYTIDLVFSPDRRSYRFRYTRHVTGDAPPSGGRSPRLGIAGSGAAYLRSQKRWVRPLLRVIAAHDRERVSVKTVADHLAKINLEVHRNTPDGSVGHSCIVAWRHRKKGVYRGGGGHQFYTGVSQDPGSPSLPTIALGLDMASLADVMFGHMQGFFDKSGPQPPSLEIDADRINADLAQIPSTPDEELR